jgi:hypothetical protein
VLALTVYVMIEEPKPISAPVDLAIEAPIPELRTPAPASAPMQEPLPAEPRGQLTVESTETVDTVINIGEPMDPDDPSTWPQSDGTEVINIGEPMDPDDPSTWPQSDSTEVINIGEPMDPDDSSTWPRLDNTEVINIGEPIDPDDPYTGPQLDDTEVINIGEPMDPLDPYQ